MRHRLLAVLVAVPLVITAVVLACGPFYESLATVTGSRPANRTAYEEGHLGVVRPQFGPIDLARAYRVLSGRPPLRVDDTSAVLNDKLEGRLGERQGESNWPPGSPDQSVASSQREFPDHRQLPR